MGDWLNVMYPLWDMPLCSIRYPNGNVAGTWEQHTIVVQAQATHINKWRIENMADRESHPTPMLNELETGPWPSFVSGIKRLRDEHQQDRVNGVANDLLGQLEHSYETRKGYWKGGTVSVYGYGGGIIPRFSEVGQQFPDSKEFHA